jgi:outer membrane lipoprotein carrier protein
MSEPLLLRRRRFATGLLAMPVLPVLGGWPLRAHADAAAELRRFVREVPSGRANFVQTVTGPDGLRRESRGSFEFQRPNRFRFAYTQPFVQTIVADGQRVWVHDPDLNQVTSRRIAEALGSTPAALLAGGSIDEAFTVSAEPAAADGLSWARAVPKVTGGTIASMRVGFRGAALAALEIADSFGQRSLLRFESFEAGVALAADRFRFVPPAGADVVQE